MREVDLAGVDLNLLKLLDALLQERSVTRAGLRLGLSQPAASRALGRLRRLLADRIVVRTPKGLELTPRAAALAEPVARLLESARAIVAPTDFDPATARGRVTIAGVDYTTLLVMPALVSRLSRLAPGLDIEIPPPAGDHVGLIAADAADLALGVYDALPAGFFRRALYEEDLVCAVRRGHPVIAAGLTLERFAALSHLLVIVTGRGEAPVDVALARRGLTRRVAMRLPHFIAAPMLVAESDMILSLPRRLARRIAATAPIEILELPLEIGPLTVSMIWHERRQDDPAHAWLRRQLAEAARAAAAG
ncbi:LysR family transcriptional regulator [Inquilinus limosus]|uniref:LysR family transcriptional regulator n=1 Tax=Inquilinus limosus TaxID=171674 RepID=UPI00041A14EE|nr:LysR family transcriptional regulator [Inquilinus limosus]